MYTSIYNNGNYQIYILILTYKEFDIDVIAYENPNKDRGEIDCMVKKIISSSIKEEKSTILVELYRILLYARNYYKNEPTSNKIDIIY